MIEKYLVKKITEPVDWKVPVPGSKSMTNRALLMAVLSAGTVRVEGVLFSDDSRHFLACLVALGFTVEIEEEKKCVTVTGCGGRIPRGEAVIDVGSAGTAARFLAAMLGFSDGCYEIRCSAQMKRRPMAELFDLLSGAGLHSSRRKGIFRCASQDADTPGRIRQQGRRRGSSLLTLRRAHSF